MKLPVSPQKLGQLGEIIALDIAKKDFPNKDPKLVSTKKESKEQNGCDIYLNDGRKIEVKTATRINGIPDACINEFTEEEQKGPQFKPDFLYIITVLDEEGNSKITKLSRETVNKHNHSLKKIVKFGSSLKTALKNNEFPSDKIKINF